MDTQWAKCKLVAWALLSLLVSGCASEPGKKTEVETPTPPAYKTYTVEIKDMKFIPEEIKVKSGDQVVFINRDMVVHCVRQVGDTGWISPAIPADGTWFIMAKGSADYYCAIHKVMKGKIIVE
jgi:plastocyanin